MASPTQVTMASSLISQSSVQFMANNAAFTNFNYRGIQDDFYQRTYVPGQTINLLKDYRNTVQRGYTNYAESIVSNFYPLVLQPLYSVTIAVNIVDQYLGYSKEGFKALIRDNVARIVSQVESDICADLQTQSYMYVDNTGGSGLVDLPAKFQQPSTRLFEQGVPQDNTWVQVLSGPDYDSLVTNPSAGGMLQEFVPQSNEKLRANNALKKMLDFRTTKSQNITNHIAGTAASMSGPIQVNGAVSSGNVINLKGLTASVTNAFVVGDRITLSGVPAINLSNMNNNNFNAQFTVTQNANSDSSGDCSIQVYPAINSNLMDPNRNLNEAIPNNTVVNVLGSHKIQPAWQERGLVFVSAPYSKLEVPGFTTFTDDQTGLTLSCGIEGSLTNANNYMRLFLLCGWVWLSDLVCINASSLNN